MSKKIIFVNATSATIGGSLTILNQFVDEVLSRAENTIRYYIFVPINSNFKSDSLIEFVPVKAKRYLERIKWDISGIKKWADDNNIKPNLIISLQNTGAIFKKVPQIIYLHQPLPYAKESQWNVLKKDERKLWFYKYLYKIWIDLTIKKDHYIIIQTQWMKDALIRNGYSENRIILSRPSIKEIKVGEVKEINKTNKKLFFYPAANYKYKNHYLILEVLRDLKKENKKLANELKVVFTLDRKCTIYNKTIEYGLQDVVENVGQISYEEVLSYYKSCDVLLFPSYIETFGLPLIEASKFGKKIIVSDCEYSRDVLNGYSRAEFLECRSLEAWYKSIKSELFKNNSLDEKVQEREVVNYKANGWNSMFKLISKVI